MHSRVKFFPTETVLTEVPPVITTLGRSEKDMITWLLIRMI